MVTKGTKERRLLRLVRRSRDPAACAERLLVLAYRIKNEERKGK